MLKIQLRIKWNRLHFNIYSNIRQLFQIVIIFHKIIVFTPFLIKYIYTHTHTHTYKHKLCAFSFFYIDIKFFPLKCSIFSRFKHSLKRNSLRSITHSSFIYTDMAFNVLWTQTMHAAVRLCAVSVFIWICLWSQLRLWGLEVDGRRGRFVAALVHNKSRVCGLQLYKGSRSKCYAVYMHS